MRNLNELNQFRTKWLPGNDHTGTFRVHVCGRSFNVAASIDGLPGEPQYEHVSVTPARDRAKSCPTWEEMCAIKDLFFKPEEECVQFHPAKSRDVNIYPYRLHIWRKVGDPAFAPPMPWEMATIADRDRKLEELWEEFGDLPMDPNTECIEEPFLCFPAGASREEIWAWFDERYSGGVYNLMYHLGSGGASKDLMDLLEQSARCIECDSETCAYNPEGICILPFGTGCDPRINDDGCLDWCPKNEQEHPVWSLTDGGCPQIFNDAE